MSAAHIDHQIADEQVVRTPMTLEEIQSLNGQFELYAVGVVEHAMETRCFEGAPGEGGGSVPAVQLWVREDSTGRMYTHTLPAWQVTVKKGESVRVYKTKRGWSNHIFRFYVLPAIH